jgi:hypothetical protein
MRKIFLLLFLTQLITGCCDTNTFEVAITGLETGALLFDGNTPVVVEEENPIAKEDWVIEVLITRFETIVSNEKRNTDNSNRKILRAAVVPCGDDEFNYLNKIESISIEILNLDTDERMDITNQLVVVGTDETISEFIKATSPGTGDFLIELSSTNNLPNRITYEIEAALDDGVTISAIGGPINFNP